MTAVQKNEAFRYWERRRIVYNLLLVPPALAGWFFRSVIPAGVGDEQKIGLSGVALLFVAYAAAANLCFTYAYVLEFWFLTDDPKQYWKHSGRSLIFAAGCVLSIVLAFWSGVQIATLEYSGMR